MDIFIDIAVAVLIVGFIIMIIATFFTSLHVRVTINAFMCIFLMASLFVVIITAFVSSTISTYYTVARYAIKRIELMIWGGENEE